jgi:hypothetical protein
MSVYEMLDQYDEKLKNYSDECVPIYKNSLNKGRQPYELILKGLFDFYVFCSYLLDENIIPKDDESSTITKLFIKGSLNLHGIYTCLNSGLNSEAPTLVRSLLENYLTLKLLLEKDTDERIKLYENFKYVQQWGSIKKNLDLLEAGIITLPQFQATNPKHRIDRLEKKFDKIKSDYHPKRPYHWAWKIFKENHKTPNPSLRQIAYHLNEQFDYEKTYAVLSISVHSSPLIENMIKNGKSFTLVPSFSTRTINLTLLSIDYMGKIILEIVRKYSDENTISDMENYIPAFSLAVSQL